MKEPLFAAYPSDNITRKFQAGQILVLPVASQPSGVPMQDVLTITGTRQIWQGELAVVDGVGGSTAYSIRRFHPASG